VSARRIGALLALLPLACAVPPQALATVSASLDSSRVAAGDTVQLTLEHDGRTSGRPDLTPLQPDFDILGTSSSTSVEIVNGSASEKSEVILTLAPKITGRLTIPSLSWDGERSQPLSLTVTGPGATSQERGAASSNAARVFIETSVTPEQPYVQAAVQLTVRLYAAETLYHADLELPESGDVVTKQIGSDESSQVERNGRSYQVVTRHYLLFPLHSGKITLQGPVLDADVAANLQSQGGSDPFGGGFFGGPSFGMLRTIRPVRLHGSLITLSVRPRPAGAVGSYWLPARDVQLTASWNPSQLSAQTGDPVTLDLNLQATGLTAAQLPDLSTILRLPSGLKAYPDQPKLEDTGRDGALVGSRDQSIALMADSAGHYTIPALTLRWWDTQTNQPRVATLPARTLNIIPAPGGTSTTASAPPAKSSTAPVTTTRLPGAAAMARGSNPPTAVAQKPAPERSASGWEWISIGLAVVWLSTLAGWFWSRRSRSGQPGSRLRRHSPSTPDSGFVKPRLPDASKERAAFRAACQTNDAHSARGHLMAWATAQWGTAPAGVNAIAGRVCNPVIAELLRDLDRACYAGGDWQGAPLAAELTELPVPPAKSARERDGLAPLYP
jgi:hypothetical protein